MMKLAIALAGAAQADPIKLRIGYGVAGRGTALEFLKANAVAIRALLAYLSAATKYYLEKPLEARQIPPRQLIVRVPADVFLNMSDYYRGHDRLNEL